MVKLKKTTYRYLESELSTYFDTKNEVLRLREEIIYASKPVDENIGGGRSGGVSDPTSETATRLVTHKQLSYLEQVVDAIEKIYAILPKEHQTFIQLAYWKKPITLTMIGIAEEMNTNKNKVYKYRDEVIQLLALELGYR